MSLLIDICHSHASLYPNPHYITNSNLCRGPNLHSNPITHHNQNPYSYTQPDPIYNSHPDPKFHLHMIPIFISMSPYQFHPIANPNPNPSRNISCLLSSYPNPYHDTHSTFQPDPHPILIPMPILIPIPIPIIIL